MTEINIMGLFADWWWLILLILRPGLINTAGGYFGGVFFATKYPEIARVYLDKLLSIISGVTS